MGSKGDVKWTDLAVAAGAAGEDDAEGLLWSGSAFPFAPPRIVYEQIRHVVRHKTCYDNPASTCTNRRIRKAWRSHAS